MDPDLSARFPLRRAESSRLSGRRRLRNSHAAITLLSGVALCVVLATPSTAGASASPARVITSTVDAGYSAFPTKAVTTFTGSVSVPTVTCPPSGSVTVEPFVAVHTSGNYLLYEDQVNCASGKATSGGFFASIYPSSGGYDIAAANLADVPGAVVKFTLKVAASGKATMTISDAKSKTSASASAPITGGITNVSAETAVFGSVTPTVVPKFTTITFGAMQIDGKSLGTLAPAKYEIYDGSTLQVSTSTFSKTGTFTNHFVHS